MYCATATFHTCSEYLFLILTLPLTARSGVFPQKLTDLQLVNGFLTFFMEPDGSLPHSQAHAADIYPEPGEYGPCFHFQFLEDTF